MAKKQAATRGGTYILTAAGKKNIVDGGRKGAIAKIAKAIAKKALTAAQIATATRVAQKDVQFHLCVSKADKLVKHSK